MTDKAGGKGAAQDATVVAESGPDLEAAERAAAKAAAAEVYKKRQIEGADANVASAEHKVEQAEAGLKAATLALDTALAERKELD